MRLLCTEPNENGGFNIKDFTTEATPDYAILSHTWEHDEEVTFQEIITGQPVGKKGFQKIESCCATARRERIKYVWIDTCCIDKSSSAELSEAINSMYRWYENARICYVYLYDVLEESKIAEGRWFTRGWTLQELIAPSNMIFFNAGWNMLGTKNGLQAILSTTTGIPTTILSGEEDIDDISVAQRLSWASKRVTTRVEDRAYSLLGIFGINMPLIYGEGERSFIRLQEEILKVIDDQTIFAWRSHDHHSGLLATSPDAFEESANIISHDRSSSLNKPLTQTNKGIHLELQLIGKGAGMGLAILNCVDRTQPNRRIGIYLRDLRMTLETFERVYCDNLQLVDLTQYKRSDCPLRKICVQQKRLPGLRKPSLSKRLTDESLFLDEKLRPSNLDLLYVIDHKMISQKGPMMALRAAQKGNLETLWMFLTRGGVKPNLQDVNGRTSLSYAAQRGHKPVVELLLAQENIDCDLEDTNGRTPLSFAASAGYEAIVDLLIETRNVNIDSKDKDGLTPLAWAARNGHNAVVPLLLVEGAEIESKDHDLGRSPLVHAATNGHDAVVQQLLMNNPHIESRDSYGWTALLCSARAGHATVVGQLLEGGAYIEAKDNEGWTALICAAENGHAAVVQLLLEKGANTESKDYHYGWTPLGWAAVNGHDRVVEQLLMKDVDIESRDNNHKRTPLSWAAGNGYGAVVQQLLGKGADTESKDNHESRTPLSYAAGNGHQTVVELLLDNGASVESNDAANGWNPLMYASWNSHEGSVQQLLALHIK